ncbi:kinesin-like protein KIF13A isoform X10 [Latimeria chalumnae]|uniref:kinesin-like protein KIF13A isoform X10 n=1 Tax=Latimeria chalumnae TaxID=7897 RepID=UPI00313DAC9E
MSDTKVKVAVRVRPMNRREIELNTKCVVEMEENQTILHQQPPSNTKGDNRKPPKVFAFDYCFWSMDESNTTKYAGQEVVFKCLGEGILENAFQGYNACIFAYGQTGSGKSFSMMGNAEQPGLIPRLCCALFKRVSVEENETHTFKVEVSYMEIYNEKVRDLLDPKGSRQSLKVREHKVFGPYVDGLSQLAVTSFEDIESVMSEGNKSRTVAATNMNEESSRSHAVFNIILTQTLYDLQTSNSGEKVSKVSLVDLAGSERVSKTGAAGERLKEGSNINKSLTTLGLVISALADQAAGKGKSKFVPYRDSVLTWLLKDNLGGNSKTAMIATISPAADNYEETLSTLRYADRAKRIVNHAVVNEDPNAKIIRELREEVEKLKEQLSQAESLKAPELKEKLEESEKLIKELTITWEEKLRKTEEIAQERQKQLESMGISLESSGIKVGDDKCFLVNLNADPALNELLVYYLKDHNRIGADTSQDIQLFGIGIQPEHCVIDIAVDGDIILTPKENARTCVNGTLICSVTHLWHGDRILWGNNHFFRVNLPKRKRRDRLKEIERESYFVEHDVETASEASSEPDYNYEFAQMEVIMKTLNSNGEACVVKMNLSFWSLWSLWSVYSKTLFPALLPHIFRHLHQTWNKDPVQNVVQILEKQYLEEKQNALEEQRMMYERELEHLRQQLSPDRQHRHSIDRLSFMSQTAQQKVRLWSEERDELFHQSLAKLREQIVKANTLVREANFLSEEMNKQTDYQVTLQIPAANLSANRKRGATVSEPAIQVRRKGKGTQVWTIEKLENKLIDMRELYQEWKENDPEKNKPVGKRGDPFYEAQENHNLIGVANAFLECLFHDVKLQYAVPVISQQGEVSGRLHVEVMRVSGAVPERLVGGDDSSENSSESGSYEVMDSNGDIVHMAKKLTCRVRIREVTGLPLNLSNFVFCQYTFWDQSEATVAPPMVNPDMPSPRSKEAQFTVKFDHCKEEDLNCVRERWSEALIKRREYLHEQIQKIINKQEKTEDDVEREARLVEQWVGLTEERNAVLVPAPGSGIPGAPADWTSPPGMEAHVPVLFLDLNADDLTANEHLMGPHAAGVNSILPKEHGSLFFYLPIIKHSDEEVSAVASWDSSVHDSVHLNRVTPQNERIYLIVKTTVQLSHPASVELVLRKRIAINVYNKQSFTQSLKRRMSLKNVLFSCGVTYEIVSNIPKATKETEDRETLALIAARSESEGSPDGETYIEKYTRGVLEVENILSLERLRQAVTVKEALSSKGKHIRRSISTPNVHHVSSSRLDLSGCEEDDTTKGRIESQLEMLDCSSSCQDVSLYGSLPRDSPRRNKEIGGTGSVPESPHAPMASPFKAFSPQPPKFFKALMPVKEEHKGKNPLEMKPLLGQEIMRIYLKVNGLVPVAQDSEEDENELEVINKKSIGSQGFHSFQPYVPEDFADFEVYNASLENRDLLSSKPDFLTSRVLEKEVSRSPTTSSMTSGYFSNSASNATLSDMLVTGSESTDYLATQIRDSEPHEHTPHIAPVESRSSLNQEARVQQRDLTREKMKSTSLKETSALEKETLLAQTHCCKSETLHRAGSCSTLDSSSSTNTVNSMEFISYESMEHTTNVVEDLSFTEFMGVDGGSVDFEQPDKPHNHTTGFCNEDKSTRSTMPECTSNPLLDYEMSKSNQSPVDSKRNETPCDQVCVGADSSSADGGVTKNDIDMLDCEDGATKEQSQAIPGWVVVGEHVCVGSNKTGTIQYVGPVDFSGGIWVGVELSVPAGKHDGTVQGKEYFHCKPGHGVFVRPSRLTKVSSTTKRHSSTSRPRAPSNQEKRRSAILLGSSSSKADAPVLHRSGDAAASSFSKKQENRKSWIN